MRDIRDLIPDPSSLETQQVDYDMLGDLSAVRLVRFTAEPDVIQPFGAAIVTWEVDMGDSRCSLQLNGVTVDHAGTMTVRPDRDWPYYLKANNGLHTRDLGMVSVSVNTAACTWSEFRFVNAEVKRLMLEWAAEMTGLRFRGRPDEAVVVLTGNGNIHFELRMEHVVDNLPNPLVDIRGDVALNVVASGVFPSSRRLNGYFQNLTVDSYFDWDGTLAISLGGPVLAIAAAMARDSAAQAARNNIDPLWDRIIASPNIAGTPPTGTSLHTVEISDVPGAFGLIRQRFCPGGMPPRPPRWPGGGTRR